MSFNKFQFISILLLIVCLNWFGFLTIEQTFAYYNDTESSLANGYSAATLDFAISETPDFSPEIMPNQNTTREIDLENLGSLDFEYRVKVENATGTLCNYLLLKDDLTGDFRPLSNFVSATTTFSNKSNWQFEAKLTSNNPSLQDKICSFDFVFDGWQIEGAGFSDKETIANTIHSGVWRKIVINKVYYDVDSQHGNENDNEWVELYNRGSEAIDLSRWQICDNDSCDTLSGTIPANNFALITKSGTTWNYWQIFSDVLKIELGNKIGNGLSNDADMLLLEDENGLIVDQVNWGRPTSTWENYNDNLWQPGLVPSGDGKIAARVPSGQDTDSPSDWQNLELPIISEIKASPLQDIYCGCCGGDVPQNSCSTAWHCAPGLYYSQELTITWTATTNNSSGSDNLSIDIAYITDNDCNGKISDGDSSYIIAENEPNDGIFTWSGWTNPKEFFDDLINEKDTHLWKDKDGKVVPYFYGLTWFRITATGPENFMINNSETSQEMFEPLPPGVSLEELCALEGAVSNICSLCQQLPKKENGNSNDNDKDNDEEEKEEEKPTTNEENYSSSATSTTDIFEEEIKDDEIDDEEIIDGLPTIKEMPTSTDEMSKDSLENNNEENLEGEQPTSVEEVGSENSGQSEGETIEDDFESSSQETNLEEATTTLESEITDSENEIVDSESEIVDSENEIIESEKENEAGEEVVDEEADSEKENDNQTEKENNGEEENDDEEVNNNQTEVSQEEQVDNKETDDSEQSEAEKEEDSNQGEEETKIKNESQPPIKEEESTDLGNSETDEGEKENESDNQQQDSQTEPEAKTDDSLNTSSELPNS